MYKHVMHISSLQAGKFDYLKMRGSNPMKVGEPEINSFTIKSVQQMSRTFLRRFSRYFARKHKWMEGGEPTFTAACR